MANTLSPLTKNQADDLFSEINSLLEDDTQDESQPKIGMQNHNVLPTKETFDKAEVLQCLKILEPNSVIFFQDLNKLIQMYLSENAQSFESEDAEYLKEKYLIRDDNSLITLRRIAAVFPSLTCNLLKCNTFIARPISPNCLSDSYPRPMTTRCFFSLIPFEQMVDKLALIQAALLYQLLEQAKFNTIKMDDNRVNYAEHMQITVDYCSVDYKSEFESNEKRVQQFNELELYKCNYPIAAIYEAAKKLTEIVGNGWKDEIIRKFRLIGIDFD